MNPTIICDIDGTIADCSHRLHMITNVEKKDWDAFHDQCYKDKPIRSIIWLLRWAIEAGTTIILITGRSERNRRMTEEWLAEYAVPYHLMFMRANGDYRADNIIKEEVYRSCVEGRFDVMFVLEDRTRVVQMWRTVGLQCLQVEEGSY